MASLYAEYVKSGFPPDNFWRLTPRLFVVQLQAASKRQSALQALAAEAAWVGVHNDLSGLNKYTATLRGEETALPPEALEGMLRSAGSDLPVMSWTDYLKQRG